MNLKCEAYTYNGKITVVDIKYEMEGKGPDEKTAIADLVYGFSQFYGIHPDKIQVEIIKRESI